MTSPTLSIRYLPNYDRAWGDIGYAKPGDAGFDLRAAIDRRFLVPAGERRLIPCGIAVAVPYGFELQVRSRSGLTLKQGLVVANSPGTVDAGYRGEIGVILHNIGHEARWIDPGDRIAQGVLAAVAYMPFNEVSELPPSDRGTGGFGSTGVG